MATQDERAAALIARGFSEVADKSSKDRVFTKDPGIHFHVSKDGATRVRCSFAQDADRRHGRPR